MYHHRKGIKMVDGNVEEPLQLLSMQIHRQHSLDPCGRQKICHELGGDRNTRLVLAVLAGIAEKWDHRCDAGRTRPPGGIHQNQQLHQVLVGRRTGGLNNEDVAAADVFIDLYKSFTVRKRTHCGIAKRHAEVGTDIRHQARVSRAGDDFQLEGAAKHGALKALNAKKWRALAKILKLER